MREMQDVLVRCRPYFYRTAYRQLNNAADTEDAVQDATLVCLQALRDALPRQSLVSVHLELDLERSLVIDAQ
jgi:DNA-directed RNA polymerase specialized sigma24 family protein